MDKWMDGEALCGKHMTIVGFLVSLMKIKKTPVL